MPFPVATAIAVGGDLLLSIMQSYMIAAKQQGLTDEQAKAYFLEHVDGFMEATARPVDPPKEG